MMSAPSTSRRGQDVLAGHHHAHVDDLEVVALQHDGDDVLADVVHVALDGGDDDLSLGLSVAASGLELALQLPPRCRAAGGPPPASSRAPTSPPAAGTSCPAEQVADDVHAVHQRAFDHVRAGGRRSASSCQHLLGVGDDEVVMPLHQRVLRRSSPAGAQARAAVVLHRALDALGDLEQALGRVRAAVQHHVLDALAQLGSRSS